MHSDAYNITSLCRINYLDLIDLCFSLLDAVMKKDVIMAADDDVTVLNKPVQTKYYQQPSTHGHPNRDYDF